MFDQVGERLEQGVGNCRAVRLSVYDRRTPILYKQSGDSQQSQGYEHVR